MKRAGWLALGGLVLLGGLLDSGQTICPLPLRPRASGPPVTPATPVGRVSSAGQPCPEAPKGSGGPTPDDSPQ